MARTRVVVTGMEKNSGHILVVEQTEFVLYWVEEEVQKRTKFNSNSQSSNGTC